MSSQTVYFNNPSDITTLQTQVSELRVENGYGQIISSTGIAGVKDQLNKYVYGTTPNDARNFGGAFYGGNIKSGQEFAFYTGTANGSGLQFSSGTLYNWASAGKLLTGLVCSKMIEEGYFTSTTPIYTLSPVLASMFTGSAQYFSDITITAPGSFPADGTYTATTGSYNLNYVTLNDIVHNNLGLINDFFVLPSAATISYTSYWSTGSTSLYTQTQGNPSLLDKGLLVQSYKLIINLLTNGTSAWGLASKYFNGAPFDPSVAVVNGLSDFLEKARDGTMPLLYASNSKINDIFPFLTRVLPATYDTSFYYLGLIINETLKQYGKTYLTYVREKFLTPLEMNNSYIPLMEQIPSDNLSDIAWRRSVVFNAVPFTLAGASKPYTLLNPATYPTYGCSPSYATGAFVDFALHGVTGAAGPLAWSKSYPDDGISRVLNVANWQTGSSTGCCIGNSPLISTIEDFGKLVKLLGNKGIAPNGTRLLKTETWNYLIGGKVNALQGMNSRPNISTDTSEGFGGNFIFCMGFSRGARDTSNNAVFGYDETTIAYNGIFGCQYYVDLYTGNWFIVFVPQTASGNGTNQLSQQTLNGLLVSNGLPANSVRNTWLALAPQSYANSGSAFVIKMIQ